MAHMSVSMIATSSSILVHPVMNQMQKLYHEQCFIVDKITYPKLLQSLLTDVGLENDPGRDVGILRQVRGPKKRPSGANNMM